MYWLPDGPTPCRVHMQTYKAATCPPAAQQQHQTSQLRSLGTLTEGTCTAQALTQQLHGDKCVNAAWTPDQAKLKDPAQ